jgi:hypothetical protein
MNSRQDMDWQRQQKPLFLQEIVQRVEIGNITQDIQSRNCFMDTVINLYMLGYLYNINFKQFV